MGRQLIIRLFGKGETLVEPSVTLSDTPERPSGVREIERLDALRPHETYDAEGLALCLTRPLR